MFAGSNVVGQHFKPKYRIVSNDLLYSSYVTAQATIANNHRPEFKRLRNMTGIDNPLEYLNHHDLSNYHGGFITEHYSLRGDRMYFQVKNAKRIDFVRTKIRKWRRKRFLDKTEFFYLLNSLIQAVPFVSNITGTYSAYLKNWDKRSYKNLTLEPSPIIDNHKSNVSNRMDSLVLAHQMSGDIVYIDTPYNARQYAPNYHILETVALYDYPKLHGKTGMRNYRDEKSTFAMKSKAEQSMEKLLHKLNFHHVLISYSTDGIISVRDMCSICRREAYPGTFKMYKIPYRKYKSKIVRKSKLYELLFYFQPKYYWAERLTNTEEYSQKTREVKLCGSKS